MNITIHDVKRVILTLQQQNIPITNRAIRAQLGKGSYSTINKFRRLLEPSKVYFDASVDTGNTDLISSLKSEIVGLRQEIALLREEIRAYLDTVSDTVDTLERISKILTQERLLNANGKPFTTSTLQRWTVKSK